MSNPEQQADTKASMGPRSHERGNSTLHAGKVKAYVASMGPRSHERGNDLRRHSRRRREHASMGPRSHERGNVLEALVAENNMGSFNGAAFS